MNFLRRAVRAGFSTQSGHMSHSDLANLTSKAVTCFSRMSFPLQHVQHYLHTTVLRKLMICAAMVSDEQLLSKDAQLLTKTYEIFILKRLDNRNAYTLSILQHVGG
nr:hypothetical protein PsAHV6-013 [Psittacid alphaherpesvirus 6]